MYIDWYKDDRFFGEDYLKLYTPLLTEERTLGEINFIDEVLALPSGARILDLCCGHGRHSLKLAQRGYRVTGLDITPLFLGVAREEAAKAGVEVEFIEGDMREIPFEDEFDAVINIFTSFGFFENEEEDFKVIKQVDKALKDEGKFILDTINRERILANFMPKDWEKFEDGTLTITERTFDHKRSMVHCCIAMLKSDGTEKEMVHSLRLYTLREFVLMFKRAGLDISDVYGDFDQSKYSLKSRRMIMLAEKGYDLE